MLFRQAELKMKLLGPANRIREQRMRALQTEERLQERMQRILENRKNRFLLCLERLKGLSPLEKLSSGYAYMTNGKGDNIRSVSQVSPGENVMIQVKDGQIGATVTHIQGGAL